MAETEPIKLSILICTIPKRADFLKRLMGVLDPQIAGCNEFIEVIINDDPVMSIGAKRNWLLQRAKGKYIAFIDDDDLVSETYVLNMLIGIDKGVDCCSLIGIITDDGKNPRVFHHSIKHSRYETVSDPSGFSDIMYLRYPNHLNCIRADIAKMFTFPETNHGEDTDWATQIHHSGLLMTEHEIPETMYYYLYRSKK